MYCPNCENVYSPKKVVSTWTVKDGSVKRRRKCTKCNLKFQTVERAVVLREVVKQNSA